MPFIVRGPGVPQDAFVGQRSLAGPGPATRHPVHHPLYLRREPLRHRRDATCATSSESAEPNRVAGATGCSWR